MTVSELYNNLEKRIPLSLRCEWDNDGIMVMPDGDKKVKRVLLTLDVTEDAVEYAINHGFDLIISHHPLIFKPIRSVSDGRLVKLIRSDIAVFSFHTRLDRVDGGVNTVLAQVLGLNSLRRFGEDDLGVIGELDKEITESELINRVKTVLSAPSLSVVYGGGMIKTVAVVGGSGDDYIASAREVGADAYISGELGYNDLTDASSLGMTVIAAGHYHTENPVLSALENFVNEVEREIECERFDCNVITTL